MKHHSFLSLCLVATMLWQPVAGQTTNTKANKRKDSTNTSNSPVLSNSNTAPNKINKAANDLNAANASLNNANNSMNSTIQAANNLKATLSTVIPKKKAEKDDVKISVGSIEFEDANLAGLIAKLKETKGVKALSSKFVEGTVTIELHYKGSASELWTSIADVSKAMSKVVSMEDKGIGLQYKNAIKGSPPQVKQ